MIVKTIPAWVAETNAYVVADELGGQAVVVDVPPQPEEVGRYLAETDVSVAGLLLTHGHIDHMGGSGELADKTGAVTYIHSDDDFLTDHPEQQLRRLFGMLPNGRYDAPVVRESLIPGETLELAGLKLSVMHTPGHTPGHCCFYEPNHGILFSGDQLFAGSVGRTDLPGGSWPDLMKSMREQVMTLDDEVRVLPGHGPETTIGRERQSNPFRGEWAG